MPRKIPDDIDGYVRSMINDDSMVFYEITSSHDIIMEQDGSFRCAACGYAITESNALAKCSARLRTCKPLTK